MILGDGDIGMHDTASRATLDGLFRKAAVRHPHSIALADPPDRARVTDGAPRRLSYTEADRLISAIAARLHGLGLQTDAVVATQLPNTVESVIALLGILRAGMIAAPLPLLWRKVHIVAALGRVGAKAFITSARIDATAHGELAMQAASELFSIRHIGIFGGGAPDGTVPFDDLLEAGESKLQPPIPRAGNPAAHIAVITFDVTTNGIVPVARNHTQLIAGGLGPLLEGRVAPGATILSTTPVGSFAGIALTLMPWLLSGGTLALHHPFDLESLAAQRRALSCSVLVVPGPLIASLGDAGHLAGDELKTILAPWRGPEQLRIAAPSKGTASLVDVAAFGEIGVAATRRSEDGGPASLVIGEIGAPRGWPGAMPVIEIGRGKTGTLLLRGPMVPLHAFPPGVERGRDPYVGAAAGGFIDTGYGCKFDADGQSLAITSPPAGIIGVGGYRFAARELDALMADILPGAAVFALPHAAAGQRLAGSAPDRAAAAAILVGRGENPLITGAFRPTAAVAA